LKTNGVWNILAFSPHFVLSSVVTKCNNGLNEIPFHWLRYFQNAFLIELDILKSRTSYFLNVPDFHPATFSSACAVHRNSGRNVMIVMIWMVKQNTMNLIKCAILFLCDNAEWFLNQKCTIITVMICSLAAPLLSKLKSYLNTVVFRWGAV